MRWLLLLLGVLSLAAPGCARATADSPEDRCLSRQEAIHRANEEDGRPEEATAITAELISGKPWQPGVSEQVWAVSYHCVPVAIHGPQGRLGPPYEIADWGVVIDAESGAFIVAGSSGDPRKHCPHH